MLFSTFIIIATCFGLLLGSFLNVAIYRLPKTDAAGLRANSRYGWRFLAWPMSFCPHCKTPIKPWHNIPLLGFLMLRGMTKCCQRPISWCYPFVEICGALIVLSALLHYRNELDIALVIIFLSMLLILSAIDWQRFYLLDILTLPLLWIGLLANLDARFALLTDAVIGAAGGYLALASLSTVLSMIIGRRAMGIGDYKLFAALGAWIGYQSLPMVLFLAATLGIVLGGIRYLVRGRGRHIPFGPCLSLAGALMLFYGDSIMLAYWDFVSR